MHQYITRFANAGLDIICMQEVHRYKSGDAIIQGMENKNVYDTFWAGTGSANRYSGVGMAIRKNSGIVMLDEPTIINSRIMTVVINFHGNKLSCNCKVD